MACPCVSGVAALGLSYAYKLNKTFTREEFISMLLTSVNNLDSRLTDNKLKVSGYSNGMEQTADLGLYRGKMGTGAVDAWKLLMAVEGTPSLTVKVVDASESYKQDLQKMKKYILDRTEIPSSTLSKKKNNDWTLDADDCIKYGVCHHIVETLDDIL